VTISLNGGHVTDLVRARAFTDYRIVGWAPNGRQVAYTRDSGKPGTASCCGPDPRGGRVHSLLAVTGPSVAWSPSDQITIAGSAQPRKVFASLNGTAPAKLIFRLPSKVAVIAIDPQPD